MTIFVRLGFYSVLILLTGCASFHALVANSKTLPACRQFCLQTLQTCAKLCHNDDGDCEMVAKNSTRKHFCEYVHEQSVKGGIIARELKSYRDPLQCRKITCDCRADYRVCTAACTGTIHKRLQAAPVF